MFHYNIIFQNSTNQKIPYLPVIPRLHAHWPLSLSQICILPSLFSVPPTSHWQCLHPNPLESYSNVIEQINVPYHLSKLEFSKYNTMNVLNDQYNLVLTAIMANTENTDLQIGHFDKQPRKSSFRQPESISYYVVQSYQHNLVKKRKRYRGLLHLRFACIQKTYQNVQCWQ